MNGLDERLTNDLTGLVAAAEFRPEGAAAIANAVRRRRQTRRLRQVALVAAVGVAVAGFVARERLDSDPVRTGNDPSPSTVTVGPSTSTTAPLPPLSDKAALTGDGLGSVRFGDDIDTVVAALEAELGPPTSDYPVMDLGYECQDGDGCGSEWVNECSGQGTYTVMQAVDWNGLTVIFRGADADSLVLKSWSADERAELGTPEGLWVADNPLAWQSTYGDLMTIEPFQESVKAVTLDLQGEITGYAVLGSTPYMISLAAGFVCETADF